MLPPRVEAGPGVVTVGIFEMDRIRVGGQDGTWGIAVGREPSGISWPPRTGGLAPIRFTILKNALARIIHRLHCLAMQPMNNPG